MTPVITNKKAKKVADGHKKDESVLNYLLALKREYQDKTDSVTAKRTFTST